MKVKKVNWLYSVLSVRGGGREHARTSTASSPVRPKKQHNNGQSKEMRGRDQLTGMLPATTSEMAVLEEKFIWPNSDKDCSNCWGPAKRPNSPLVTHRIACAVKKRGTWQISPSRCQGKGYKDPGGSEEVRFG